MSKIGPSMHRVLLSLSKLMTFSCRQKQRSLWLVLALSSVVVGAHARTSDSEIVASGSGGEPSGGGAAVATKNAPSSPSTPKATKAPKAEEDKKKKERVASEKSKEKQPNSSASSSAKGAAATASEATSSASRSDAKTASSPSSKAKKSSSTQPKEPQRWTLNQRNTDIREFIDQIAKITGDTFVLDPKLNGGSVNVISSRSMTREEVYDVFLEVLNANDFAVVPKGNNVKNIVSTSIAKTQGAKLPKQPNGETLITRVIGLHSVSAIEVVPVIRPLVAQYGHTAAATTSNAVIVSDLKDNVDRITKIVQQLDNVGDNDYEVFRLAHAWASDVARVIQETLTTTNRATLSSSISNNVQVIADERSNRLIIRGNASKRARVRKLVETLDQEGVRRSSTRVMFLKYADAKNLAAILTEASKNLPSVKNNKKNTKSNHLSPYNSAPSGPSDDR